MCGGLGEGVPVHLTRAGLSSQALTRVRISQMPVSQPCNSARGRTSWVCMRPARTLLGSRHRYNEVCMERPCRTVVAAAALAWLAADARVSGL